MVAGLSETYLAHQKKRSNIFLPGYRTHLHHPDSIAPIHIRALQSAFRKNTHEKREFPTLRLLFNSTPRSHFRLKTTGRFARTQITLQVRSTSTDMWLNTYIHTCLRNFRKYTIHVGTHLGTVSVGFCSFSPSQDALLQWCETA